MLHLRPDVSFCKKLDAILGGEPTSTIKSPMDTSEGREAAERGLNLEGDIIDGKGGAR